MASAVSLDVPEHVHDLSADQPQPQQPPDVDSKGEYVYDRDYRFWSIIVALCTMQILCSLENTVVVTSLPTIVQKLGLNSNYIWVTNVFFLAT